MLSVHRIASWRWPCGLLFMALFWREVPSAICRLVRLPGAQPIRVTQLSVWRHAIQRLKSL